MNDSYQLEVKNYGPIVEASIDVRPLTVFIGPSNTGKSYLSTLIYAVHQCFGRISVGPSGLIPQQLRHWFLDRTALEAFRKDLAAVNELQTWFETVTDYDLPPVPLSVANHLYPALNNAVLFNQFFDSQIRKCHGVANTEDLIRYPRAVREATVKIRNSFLDNSIDYQSAEYVSKIKKGVPTLFGEIRNIESLPLNIDNRIEISNWLLSMGLEVLPRNSDFEPNGPFGIILSKVADLLFRTWFQPVNRIAHFLPASRAGIMMNHQLIASTLVQGAASASLRNSSLLSGVVADFLSQLFEVSRKPSHSQDNVIPKKLADNLEQAILQGSVELEKTDASLPVFSYRPNKWKENLSLKQSSSMVCELVPVVLYLRYCVRKGDVLIIEEPEAHLHPAMQATLARELVRIVRNGVRVIITTHSEWMLDQLANLVQLSHLPERHYQRLPDAEFALESSQFGAYLFKNKLGSKGTVVTEQPISRENGGIATDFSETTELLYNQWAEIENQIVDAEDE